MSKITRTRPTIVQAIFYCPPHLSGMESCAVRIIDGTGVLLNKQEPAHTEGHLNCGYGKEETQAGQGTTLVSRTRPISHERVGALYCVLILDYKVTKVYLEDVYRNIIFSDTF